MDVQGEQLQCEVRLPLSYDELVRLVTRQAELIRQQAEEIKLLKKKTLRFKL